MERDGVSRGKLNGNAEIAARAGTRRDVAGRQGCRRKTAKIPRLSPPPCRLFARGLSFFRCCATFAGATRDHVAREERAALRRSGNRCASSRRAEEKLVARPAGRLLEPGVCEGSQLDGTRAQSVSRASTAIDTALETPLLEPASRPGSPPNDIVTRSLMKTNERRGNWRGRRHNGTHETIFR